MNYYEHHLGDYAKDTTSLTMLEEGAYRRLIDVYYAKELPLPGDMTKVCKAARAMSRPEKDAVQSVLDEFFTLTPEGYRHKRCDEEIDRYQASQEGADDKRENDKDRQRRARERRKSLFEVLRSHGIVPPWDAKTHELEAHLSRVTKPLQSASVTRDESPPVTRDNTATQTPDTSPQTPKVLIPPPAGGRPIEPPADPDPEPVDVPKRSGTGLPDCPYTQLLQLWAKRLPQLTQPRVWEGSRKVAMRQRWQQAARPSSYSPEGYATEAAGITWWDSFFGYIAHDTRLPNGFGDGKPWRPDLEWVCNAANFQKIIDGKYAR